MNTHSSRPSATAYFLGRSADTWRRAIGPSRIRTRNGTAIAAGRA